MHTNRTQSFIVGIKLSFNCSYVLARVELYEDKVEHDACQAEIQEQLVPEARIIVHSHMSRKSCGQGGHEDVKCYTVEVTHAKIINYSRISN